MNDYIAKKTFHPKSGKSYNRYYPVIDLDMTDNPIENRRKRITGHYHVKHSDAKDELAQMRKEFESGSLLKRKVKVQTVYESWIKEAVPEHYAAEESLKNAEYEFLNHFLPVFGNAFVSAIGTQSIQRYYAGYTVKKHVAEKDASDPNKMVHKVIDQPGSDGSKKKSFTFVNFFFSYCVSCGYRTTNPCAGVTLQTPETEDPETWDEQELMYYLSLPYVRESKYFLGIEILATTAMRLSECCALRISDYDGKGLTLLKGINTKKRQTHMKTRGSRRYVLLMDFVKADIDLQLKYQESLRKSSINPFISGYLVTDPNNHPIEKSSLSHAFHDFLLRNNEEAAAKVDGRQLLPVIPLKNLRHTMATLIIQESDGDVSLASEVLGHKRKSTTLNYYTGKVKIVHHEEIVRKIESNMKVAVNMAVNEISEKSS